MSPKAPQPRREQAVRDLKLNLRHFVVDVIVSNYEAVESVGLNPTDIGSLCLLLLNGPAPAGRLAELTGLTTGAVTGVIDRLEAGGFVHRETDPGDRRRVIVVPNPSRIERDLFPHFPGVMRAAAPESYDGLSIGDLEVITRFLGRLVSDTTSQPDPD